MKKYINSSNTNSKTQQFFRFIIVGIIATVINYIIYLILHHSLSVNHNIAYSLGYFISFIFNYIASTRFTFKTNSSPKNIFGFLGAHCINYFLHIILLNTFIGIGFPEIIAPIFVYPIAIIINFFMVRLVLKK